MKSTHNLFFFLTLSTLGTAYLQAVPDFSLSIHGDISAGVTDGSHQRNAIHGHDPDNDYNLQGLEIGLSLRMNEYLEGFINANAFIASDEHLDGEWEEGFLKLKQLPLDLEVRAGRYFNRIGIENNVHLHGWDYVNGNLSTGFFLGEEGLLTEGAELSWVKDYTAGDFIISGSYGNVVSDEHGEEEAGANESQELAFFSDEVLTFRAQLRYNSTDYYQHKFGLNFAQGENGYNRDTEIIGADYTYTWRENGLEKGGRELSAGVEYYYRNVEWEDETNASNSGDTAQQSLALKASYAWNENWKLAARYEWIEGVNGAANVFDIDEHQRASLALTHTHQFTDDWSTHARIQYNHDKISSDQSNNLYLQLGFSFGGDEVR